MSNSIISRMSKDQYYLNIAKEVSKRSTCLRIHYGAVIVKNDRIVSTGYNGSARGFINCSQVGSCVRSLMNIEHGERYELCRSVHAEANAIIQASAEETKDAVLYLYGEDGYSGNQIDSALPCIMCQRMIVNAGIESVISYVDGEIHKTLPEEWELSDRKTLIRRLQSIDTSLSASLLEKK